MKNGLTGIIAAFALATAAPATGGEYEFNTPAEVNAGATVGKVSPRAIPDNEPIAVADGYVIDGDTVHVTLVTGQRINVRLADIDTPEVARDGGEGQPGGELARGWLVRFLDKQDAVRFVDSGTESYDRAVGRLEFHVGEDGQMTCQGLTCPPAGEWRRIAYPLVSSGLAWVNPRYNDSERLAATMEAARDAGAGLWGLDAEPVPPWEWRNGE